MAAESKKRKPYKKSVAKPVARADAPAETGRPPLDINAEQVQRLAAIDCSLDEMALVLGCSESLLQKRFSAIIEKGRAEGRQSLKRTQFTVAVGRPAIYDVEKNLIQSALAPNPTMLIWLGKIRLKQKEDSGALPPGALPVLVVRPMTVEEMRARAEASSAKPVEDADA